MILIPISCRCLSQLGNLPVAIHPPDPGAVCRVLLVEQGDQLVSLVREEHLTRDLISWTSSQSNIHLTVRQSVRFLYLCRFIGCRLLFPFFQQVPPGINLVLHVSCTNMNTQHLFLPKYLVSWVGLHSGLDLLSLPPGGRPKLRLEAAHVAGDVGQAVPGQAPQTALYQGQPPVRGLVGCASRLRISVIFLKLWTLNFSSIINFPRNSFMLIRDTHISHVHLGFGSSLL